MLIKFLLIFYLLFIFPTYVLPTQRQKHQSQVWFSISSNELGTNETLNINQSLINLLNGLISFLHKYIWVEVGTKFDLQFEWYQNVVVLGLNKEAGDTVESR